MTYRTLGTSIAGVALVALVAGCAEPSAGFFASRAVATDLAPASDLIGTWHGTLGHVRADQYEDTPDRAGWNIHRDGDAEPRR